MTKREAELKAALESKVHAALVQTTTILTYVDTIKVRVRPSVPKDALRRIEETCAGRVFVLHSRRHGDRVITMHGPTKATLLLLDELFPKHRVQRLDLAFDFLTETVTEAFELQGRLRAVLLMPWRGKARATAYEDTDYMAQAGRGRNCTVYSRRTSKITGGPACHLEARWCRVRACKSLGVYKARDVLTLDPVAAMGRLLKVAILNEAGLWRRAEKAAGGELLGRPGAKARLVRPDGSSRPWYTRQIIVGRQLRSMAICNSLDDQPIESLAELVERIGIQRVVDELRSYALFKPDVSKAIMSMPADVLVGGARKAGGVWAAG